MAPPATVREVVTPKDVAPKDDAPTTPAPIPIVPFEFTEENCLQNLKEYVSQHKPGLSKFYPTDDSLKDVAKNAIDLAKTVHDDGKECSIEIAMHLQFLALYDLVLLLDDSLTIQYEEDGKRKETLAKVLQTIATIYGHARKEGIPAVKFLNSLKGKKDVRRGHVTKIIKDHHWTGLTRIGSELSRKVLKPFVYGPDGVTVKDMTKPLLIMIITDGAVEGEKPKLLENVIYSCVQDLKKEYGEHGADAVSFHFSRVGNDEGAAKLLQSLDNNEAVGDYVDCLPINDNLEDIDSPDLSTKWSMIAKLLLGAIHPEWDLFGDEVKEVKATEDLPDTQKVPSVDEDDESCGEEDDD